MCVRRVPRLPTPHRDVRDMRILQRVCIRDGRRMDALRGRVGVTMEWHDDYNDDDDDDDNDDDDDGDDNDDGNDDDDNGDDGDNNNDDDSRLSNR